MTIKWFVYTQNTNHFKQIHESLINYGYSLIFQNKREEVEIQLKIHRNVIIFIDVNGIKDAYQYCETLSILHPHLFIILVGEERDINLMKALRCGVKDVLTFNSEEDAIEQVIKRAEKHIKHKENLSTNIERDQNGIVITACSTKGGVGKTTLVVNLATIISKENYKVAVIDLNLQFGDVPLYYDVKPKKTIYEWVKEEYGDPNSDLSKFMIKHSSGVDIFPAPIRPEFSETITEEHIQDLILQCQRQYDYILIDTPPHLSEHTLTSLEKSNEILLMTFMDLATLKNNKIFIETLEALQLKYKVRIILNRYYQLPGINPEAVEKILELPIFVKIPNNEKDITMSINEGKPYVLTSPKSSFSQSIELLARKIIGKPIGIQRDKIKERLIDKIKEKIPN